jgi:hypothetical protein
MSCAHMQCLISPATLAVALKSNVFSQAQLQYMQRTQSSRDPRDVVWHRAVTKLINPEGTERETNNGIMHALDADDVGVRIVNGKVCSARKRKKNRK